jgi:hypothetical protein
MRKIKINDMLNANLFSAHRFKKHAEYVLDKFDGEIQFLRTVVYVSRHGSRLKIYAHRDGLSREYISICDWNGKELESLHCSVEPKVLYEAIIKHLETRH